MSMSYLDYLNAFNQWLEVNALPGNAQLLYFRLLNLFNRAGWPEYVQVDNLRLMLMTDSGSRPTAIRARDNLAAAGFITFEKGRKGCPGKYKLTSTSRNLQENILSKNFTECVTESEQNVLQNPCRIRAENVHIPIKTKNKTKTKNNPPSPPVVSQEETGFGAELQATFEDWLRYKNERKENYKPTGLKHLISRIRSNAETYGEAAVADLIRQSMASNWQGIFYDRLERSGYGRTGNASANSSASKDWGVGYDNEDF